MSFSETRSCLDLIDRAPLLCLVTIKTDSQGADPFGGKSPDLEPP